MDTHSLLFLIDHLERTLRPILKTLYRTNGQKQTPPKVGVAQKHDEGDFLL